MAYYNSNYSTTPEEYDSEYDSTWDNCKTEEPKRKRKSTNKDTPWKRAARDSQRYRNGYMENWMFYQNKKRFDPDGEFIDYIHEEWKTKYDLLEKNHNFIQWLFPIQEQGVNRQASPLTPAERKRMKKNSGVIKRFLQSYKLMLGFYGIELMNEETGEVTRARNWEERFRNLNSNIHNNLRITRILKCLGEFRYEHFQAPLVRFFLEETLCNGNLPRVKKSVLDYFMSTVKNKEERQKLVHFAWVNYKPQGDFIWGPIEILKEFDPTIKGSRCGNPQPSQAPSEEEFGNSSSEEIADKPICSSQDSSTDAVDTKCFLYRSFQMLSKLPLLSLLFHFISSPFRIFNIAYRYLRPIDKADKKEPWGPEVIEHSGHKGTSMTTDISRNIQNTEPEWPGKVNKASEDGSSDNKFEVSRTSLEEQDQQQEQTIKFETEVLSVPQTHKKDALNQAVVASRVTLVKAEESINENSGHGRVQVEHSGSSIDPGTLGLSYQDHSAFEQNSLSQVKAEESINENSGHSRVQVEHSRSSIVEDTLVLSYQNHSDFIQNTQAAQGDPKPFEGTEKSNTTEESKERENQESQGQFTGNVDRAGDDQNTRNRGTLTGNDPESQLETSGEQSSNEKSSDCKADKKVADHREDESADLGFLQEEEALDAVKQPESHEGQKKGEMMLNDAITSQGINIRALDDGGKWGDSGAALDNTETQRGKDDTTQNSEDGEDREVGPGAHIGEGIFDDKNSKDSGTEEGCSSEDRTGIAEAQEAGVRTSSGVEEKC